MRILLDRGVERPQLGVIGQEMRTQDSERKAYEGQLKSYLVAAERVGLVVVFPEGPGHAELTLQWRTGPLPP